MVVNNIIKQLSELGFSEYEARAYTALLKNNPSTAYETARLSGIPSSKIYGVMDRLAEKEVVTFSEERGRKLYVPKTPEEFIESRRSRVNSSLDDLQRELEKMSPGKDISYIWNIRSREFLIEKARRTISASRKSILLSGWSEELDAVSEAAEEAASRKIKISTVHFGETQIKYGQLFYHPIRDTIYNEKGGRGFTLVADSREALSATVFDDGSAEGAWSENPGFVILAEDYIKHDVYIMKIVSRFDSMLTKRFGKNYKKLRDVFHDEEVK